MELLCLLCETLNLGLGLLKLPLQHNFEGLTVLGGLSFLLFGLLQFLFHCGQPILVNFDGFCLLYDCRLEFIRNLADFCPMKFFNDLHLLLLSLFFLRLTILSLLKELQLLFKEGLISGKLRPQKSSLPLILLGTVRKLHILLFEILNLLLEHINLISEFCPDSGLMDGSRGLNLLEGRLHSRQLHCQFPLITLQLVDRGLHLAGDHLDFFLVAGQLHLHLALYLTEHLQLLVVLLLYELENEGDCLIGLCIYKSLDQQVFVGSFKQVDKSLPKTLHCSLVLIVTGDIARLQIPFNLLVLQLHILNKFVMEASSIIKQ